LKKTAILLALLVFGLFCACGGGRAAPPPKPIEGFSVKLDGQALKAFDLAASSPMKREGQISVMIVLEPKSSMSVKQIKLTGKTDAGKEATVTLSGPVSAGQIMEGTFTVDEGTVNVTFSALAQ